MKVLKEDTLLNYLLNNVENKSKNNIKSLLVNGNIYVNGKNTTRYDYKLKPNDEVEIINKVKEEIEVIYEDKDLIVVNKPSGLLTISTEKEKEKTLYRYVSDYLKKRTSGLKVFIVHRLDKDTSGIVVFAKNEKIKELLQNNWNDIADRTYIAIVEGIVSKKEGTIKSYIKENKIHKSYSSDKGELAITEYKVLKTNSKYSLLEINIKTGKKNQIRVHLNDIGHKIVGDKKYDSNVDPIHRLCLHAQELKIINPITKKELCFKASIPKEFNKLI